MYLCLLDVSLSAVDPVLTLLKVMVVLCLFHQEQMEAQELYLNNRKSKECEYSNPRAS